MRLAQTVVETVMGESADELMSERIFKPLGMTRTQLIWDERFETILPTVTTSTANRSAPERRKSADAAGSMSGSDSSGRDQCVPLR